MARRRTRTLRRPDVKGVGDRGPRDWAFFQFQMTLALETIGQPTGDMTRFKAQREPMLQAADTFEATGLPTNAAAARGMVAAMVGAEVP